MLYYVLQWNNRHNVWYLLVNDSAEYAGTHPYTQDKLNTVHETFINHPGGLPNDLYTKYKV